jgi:hypothetical protein
MSKCVDCFEEMEPCDAQIFLECKKCRKESRKSPWKSRVRTLYHLGSELVGRKTRPSHVLGGAAERPDENYEAEEIES